MEKARYKFLIIIIIIIIIILSSFVPSFIQVISVAIPNYALKHKCQIGGMASFPCSLTRRLCHADELQYYKGETLSGP